MKKVIGDVAKVAVGGAVVAAAVYGSKLFLDKTKSQGLVPGAPPSQEVVHVERVMEPTGELNPTQQVLAGRNLYDKYTV